MRWISFALLLIAAHPAQAARPVVLELFTSESCSSCPPAEALLAELARTRTDVLPLALHVDYWNRLNWRDRYTLPGATERQRDYAARLGAGVYTPQLVADGHVQAVGSDREAVAAAITRAQADAQAGPAMTVSRHAGQVTVRVGEGAGSGKVLLVGFDAAHSTLVGAGENAGVRIDEVNVVRSLRSAATWTGKAVDFTAPEPNGEHIAAMLQAPDGRILAVAQP